MTAECAMDNRKPGLVAPEFSAVQLPVEQPCAEYETRLRGGNNTRKGGVKRKPTWSPERELKEPKTWESQRRQWGRVAGISCEVGEAFRFQDDPRVRLSSSAPLTTNWRDKAVLDIIVQQAQAVVDLNLDQSIGSEEDRMGLTFVDTTVGGLATPGDPLLRQCSHPEARHSALAYREVCSTAMGWDAKDPATAGMMKLIKNSVTTLL